MIQLRYNVISYKDDPKQWDFFKVLAEIFVDDKCFWVIYDPLQNTVIIREYFQIKKSKFEAGNILASIEDDYVYEQILLIAKKEGIIR